MDEATTLSVHPGKKPDIVPDFYRALKVVIETGPMVMSVVKEWLSGAAGCARISL